MNEFEFLPVAHAATHRSTYVRPAVKTAAASPVIAEPAVAAAVNAEPTAEKETVALTEEAGAEAEAEKGGLEIMPAVIASQVFNFILLVAVLHLILYKPLLKIMKDREKRIRDGVENAEKADGMLKESNIIRQDMIKRANSESQEMLESARKSGEEVKSGIIQGAHAEAGQIIKSGQNLIEMEKAKTAQELKGLAVGMIVSAAEKILKEKLDPSKDSKLIEESLKGYSA